MTKAELNERIQELEGAMTTLSEPEKTNRKIEMNDLKMQLEGLALSEVVSRLRGVSLPDTQNIDKLIQQVKDTTVAEANRIAAFGNVVNLLRRTIGL